MFIPPLQELLAKYPCGQQRSSARKQFVILYGDVALKGPFTREVATVIHARSQTLKTWNSPAILHPLGCGSNEDGYWLIYNNLLKGRYEECKMQHIKESYSDYSYTYYVEGPLVPMSHLEDYTPPRELLLSAVHCFILNVGDMGLRNVLVQRNVGGDNVYVTDYDENSSGKSYGPMFYFRHPPGKKHKWEAKVRSHYDYVLQQLPLIERQLNAAQRELYNHAMTILQAARDGRYGIFDGMMSSNTKTASGHSFDVMKSALQKYIRRGDERAIPVFAELWALSYLDKGVRTNLYNRLVIIACEDIGIANPALVHLVLKHKGEDFGNCIALIRAMLLSPKTRIASHLYFCYSHPLQLKNHVSPRIHLTNDEWQWLRGAPIHNILRHYIEQQSFLAVTWIYLIFTNKSIPKTPKSFSEKKTSTTNAAAYAWEIFASYTSPQLLPTMRLLETCYYKQENSRRVFLMHALLLLLTRSRGYDVTREEEKIFTTTYNEGDYIPLRQGVEVDAYIVDKHTRQGREQGANTQQFVEEGAIVTNEDMTYHYPELHFHYTYSRREE